MEYSGLFQVEAEQTSSNRKVLITKSGTSLSFGRHHFWYLRLIFGDGVLPVLRPKKGPFFVGSYCFACNFHRLGMEAL